MEKSSGVQQKDICIYLINYLCLKKNKMSKPQSIIIDPWTDFPKQPYHSILRDDFCHDKFYVEKLQFKNNKGAVNIKAAIDSKNGEWKIADEVKLWFELQNNKSVYGKIKSSDYLKFQYDNGVVEWQNRKWNIYGGFNTDKGLKKWSFKLGVAHLSDQFNSDNRFRVNYSSSGSESIWYNRSVLSHQKWKFGLLHVYNISTNVLQKNAFLISYTHDAQHSAYLRGEVQGFRKKNPDLNEPLSILDNVIFNYVNVINDKTKAAIEASYSLKDKKINTIEGVLQQNLNSKTLLKIGVDHQLGIKFLVRKPLYWFEDIAKISSGVRVSGLKNGAPVIQTGFQIEANI